VLDHADLEAEWTCALSDAGMPPERARLYVVDGAASFNLAYAMWYRPGYVVVRDHDFPEPLDVEAANAPENIDAHRIVVWRDATAALVGATLRHELEHARQYDALGAGLFELYNMIRFGVFPHQAGGLPGCSGAYMPAIPAERDADAAAAVYLREHHPDAGAEIRAGERRNLACSILPPEPHDTLPLRMVAFMALHPSACAAHAAAEGEDFPKLLDRAYPGAGAMWRTITSLAAPG
jgi:hypothetical protein